MFFSDDFDDFQMSFLLSSFPFRPNYYAEFIIIDNVKFVFL